MDKAILFFVGCGWCFGAYCQTVDFEAAFSDSLLDAAQSVESDSMKIHYYLELSNFWSDRDTTRAFLYLDKAEVLMPPDNDFYKGLVHFHSAGIYFDWDFKRAEREYKEADKYLQRISTGAAYSYRSRLWNNIGVLFQIQDKAESYLDILLNQAIPFARMAGDSIRVANNYQNVALVLMNLTDYAKADKYYDHAILSLSAYPHANEEKLTAFVNAAKNSVFRRDFPKVDRYLDSAKVQLEIIPHSLYAPVYYGVIGTFFRHNRNWENALKNLDIGLQLAEDYKDHRKVSALLYEKYLVFKDMGNYQAAKSTLLEAYKYMDDESLLHDRRLHLRELAYVDSKLGLYESGFDWLSQYVVLSDSAFQNRAEFQILELEEKYRSVERENEILKLKGENQEQLLELEGSKLTNVALASVLSIILLLSYFGWRLFKNKKRTIEQNDLLHRQELKSIKQKEQLKIYNAMLQGQEQERNRIARDLHDGLGGMLAGVKLRLSSVASRKDVKLNQPDMEIYKIIHQLDQSVDELRRIARNMMPESLLYMGIKPALSDLCESMSTEETVVEFEAFNLGDTYEQALQIAVYRIVQELLTNALKHGRATNVVVQCSENGKRLYITVEDDGKGFDPEEVGGKNGIGLSNIRNRVNLLQGNVEINSILGEGTTFNIEIPLNEK